MSVTVNVAGHDIEMTADDHKQYADEMRRYYARLPRRKQLEPWMTDALAIHPDLREEFEEREAIQHAAEEAQKNVRLFSKWVS